MARTNGKERGIYEKVKDSGNWSIRYTDEHGRIHREQVGPKGLARAVLAKRRTEVRERKFFPNRIGRQRVVLFDELAQDFLDYSADAKRSYKTDVSRMKLLLADFGGKPATSVTPGDIERFKWNLFQKSLAPATVKHYLILLSAVYTRGILLNKVQHNPVRGIKPIKLNNARVRYLSKAEEPRLFSELPKDLHEIVELALLTGLRRSNLLSLERKNIDLVANVYTVPTSKSGDALRLPLHPRAIEILSNLPEDRLFVFEHNGKPYRNIDWFFRKAVQRAAIPDFKFHDLRHTWASRLAMEGVPLHTIMKLGGWKTLSMVQRYAHLSPDHLREELGRLSFPSTGTSTNTEEKRPSMERSEEIGNNADLKAPEAVDELA